MSTVTVNLLLKGRMRESQEQLQIMYRLPDSGRTISSNGDIISKVVLESLLLSSGRLSDHAKARNLDQRNRDGPEALKLLKEAKHLRNSRQSQRGEAKPLRNFEVGFCGFVPMGAEKRGALIVLEGLDRSGKSSQCQRLVDFLKGIGLAAEAWRFPDRATAIGSSISAYLSGGSELDDRAVHLLFSANRWEKRQQMEKQLMAGTTLVVDRYSYSGVAFSAAKGLDMEWCKAPEIGLPAADLVLYLDISPEEAAKRGGYGVERYEQLDFQRKVASQYKNLQDKRWKIVDARQSFDQVHELMREACVKTVSLCLNGYHLSRLWTGLLMALVYHFDAIARAGRLEATFLLHDIEHDTSFTIDSSFDANLPEGPWEFTIMAAAGDLCCVRGRHPTQQDVLMLCSPQQRAWKRLPLCNTVRRFKRVGLCFHKDADDYSYKVLVIELDGETMVTEVFDSRLDAWSTLVQQEKKFHKLLGRCEFSRDAQEFYHLVVKEALHADDQFTNTENVYSTIRYTTSLGGWQIVDINLPERMTDDYNDGCSSAYRRVTNASFVGSGNCLKLLVETESWSADFTRDFEQNDTLVYEYDQASGKWRTLFLCSCTNGNYSFIWKEKVNNRKYRWFKEGSRWYPAVIGTSGMKNALRIDCVHGSDSESDIGSGEHVVPVPQHDHLLPPSKRRPRRKLPRGRGDPRLEPSEEVCALMLKSLENHLYKRFGHGNKVFMITGIETRIVVYDCITHQFNVIHLSEPCVLRNKSNVSGYANWDPICVDLDGESNLDVWKQQGFSVQENQHHKATDGDDKFTGGIGNGLLVYDMTSMVTGDGRLMVTLMVHDVVEDKSGVLNLVYDAGLEDVAWEVEIVATARCYVCFRCKHTTHEDVYLICKPACNSWQMIPPIYMGDLQSWCALDVGMYVDDTQASYKVLISAGSETVMFDSESCKCTTDRKKKSVYSCKYDKAYGGFLALEHQDACVAFATQSRKWKPTKILLPEYSGEMQLFGSQDWTFLMVQEHKTARCAVYGVNISESKLEPILSNEKLVREVGELRGATILEDLEETEVRELVLEATECFARGDCIFWAKAEEERVVMYDCVGKQFKVLHIVSPWGINDDVDTWLVDRACSFASTAQATS